MKTAGRHSLRLFFVAVFVLSLPFAGFAARRYVIPTWYGYGTVSPQAPIVAPYIIASTMPSSVHPGYLPYYLPSQDPAYYSSYRPWNPYGVTGPGYYFSTPAGQLAPFWDGMAWSYRQARPSATSGVPVTNLNLRSDPGFGSRRNHDRNVIGSVARGEPLYVFGRYGDWYYVQSASDPRKYGYAYARYIQIQGEFTDSPMPVWTGSDPRVLSSTAWPHQSMQPVPMPPTGAR